MTRTTWVAHAVAVMTLALGACANAPERQAQAGLSADPIASEEATGSPVAPIGSLDKVGASAPVAVTPPESHRRALDTRRGGQQASQQTGSSGGYSDGTSAEESALEPVGPAASYEDPAGDATGTSQIAPVSQASFDILSVTWSPVSYDEPSRRGYSTSITIAGPAREDGAYVAFGFFSSGGQSCQIYHILEIGIPAYANAFCGSVEDGTRRFLGRMDGRLVSSSPTADGGTTLVGIFDDPAVPSSLEADGRMLYGLSAFTAMCSPSPDGCRTHDTEFDWVDSGESFRV